MNYKKIRQRMLAWAGVVVLAGSMSACGAVQIENHTTASAATSENMNYENVSDVDKLNQDDIFSDKDKEIGYEESSCVSIHLEDSASTCEGNGVVIEQDVITISKEGTYLLSGSLSNGQIIIDADKDKVRLILNGVNINCDTSAAIYVRQADKVFVTLAEGGENHLSNKEAFVAIDDNAIDSVIFSKDDLTFNGLGSLEVNAAYGNGIVSKDDLKITGGSYSITAQGHALEGKDSVAVADGDLTLKAGKDGIHSENSDDENKGYVFVAGGNLTIEAEGDGIDASYLLQVDGGTIDVVAGGGSEQAVAKASQDMHMGNMPQRDMQSKDAQDGQDSQKGQFSEGQKHQFPKGQKGQFGGRPGDGEAPSDMPEPPSDMSEPAMNQELEEKTETDAKNSDTESADTKITSASVKGLKADGMIYITGGTITIDSADDAVHSNGSVQIDDGIMKLTSGDDGVHASEALMINGGQISVSKSYEGLEGMTITVNSGEIEIASTDDGINAAGGADQSGVAGTREKDSFGASEDCWIELNGGKMSINASGDGIDSNGNLTINGGEIYVEGPENDGNAALDYGDGAKAVINGGTLVATGFSGMAENFDSSSAQSSMLVQLDETCAGGTILLTDAKGTELVTFASQKRFNSVYISCAQLKKGETYTLNVQGSTTTIEMTESNYSNSQSRFSGSRKL